MNALTKPLGAGPVETVVPILPRTADEVAAFVDAMVRYDAIPRSYASMPVDKRRGNMVVAIMKGMELGMPPLRALQSIYVVNGIPTLYGDAVPAYVLRSGKLTRIEERIEGDGDARAAIVKLWREGEPCPERRFSIADAHKLNLLGKAGPWQTARDRMLMIRARTYAYRDFFADCLDGLGVKEEQEDAAGFSGDALVVQSRAIDPLADEPSIAAPFAFTLVNSRGADVPFSDGEKWAATGAAWFTKADPATAAKLWAFNRAHIEAAEAAGHSILAQRIWVAAAQRGATPVEGADECATDVSKSVTSRGAAGGS